MKKQHKKNRRQRNISKRERNLPIVVKKKTNSQAAVDAIKSNPTLGLGDAKQVSNPVLENASDTAINSIKNSNNLDTNLVDSKPKEIIKEVPIIEKKNLVPKVIKKRKHHKHQKGYKRRSQKRKSIFSKFVGSSL